MVKTGLENFIDGIEAYKKRRAALIVNLTSMTRDFQYSWNVLKKKGLHIQRIFTPEHGIYATEQDQVVVKNQPNLDCDVVSLYGDSYGSLIPDGTLLDDIDLVLFDIQDVGSRYYTYVNTMALFMKAIDKKDIEMIILDRPNPLGGVRVEGPLLNMDFQSFVGVLPVTVRHGMTPAELALLYKDVEKLDIHLSVVKMVGWNRKMVFHETGLTWIPPSPNMPTVDTATVYPGLCLIEGLNVSEGRGTTTPFKLIGAPFVDPYGLVQHAYSMKLEGIVFVPVYFKPAFHKYADEVCGGIFLHITDVERFRPFLTGVAVVKSLFDLYHEHLIFREDVYEFNSIHPAFDLLTGNAHIRDMISNDSSLDELRDSWKKDEDDFAAMKREYHLYEY
jgi:uncharacterized protein YbbC (DUF1343 family)